MPELLRGPHHCVGVTTAVTERIFHFLKTRAEAQGGNLSVADLGTLRTTFLASLSKAGNYFEGINRQCMEACGSAAPEYFSREHILATLLSACSLKAARSAFPQAERIGVHWLHQLYGGIAKFIRENICTDADDRLVRAYLEVAAKVGAKLVIADLINDEATQRVLRECLAPLVARDAQDRLAEPLSDVVTAHIAGKRGIAKADPAKVTEAEMKKFLAFLPPQLSIAFGASAAA